MSVQMSVKSHTITPIIMLLTLTLAWTLTKIEGGGVKLLPRQQKRLP